MIRQKNEVNPSLLDESVESKEKEKEDDDEDMEEENDARIELQGEYNFRKTLLKDHEHLSSMEF